MKPTISIVMPAYNAEKYIGEAIISVISQSYSKWEMIIVNDASSDHTDDIIKSFSDPRIRIINRHSNSGAAYIPRMEAVQHATGDWILNLDADDYLEKNTLELMIKKVTDNNIDTCLPRMIYVNEDGTIIGKTIPSSESECNAILTGHQAFHLTIPTWRIGMNGALVRKTIWEIALRQYEKEEPRGVHDDENLSRLILLNSDIVVTSSAKYYFRENDTSTTRKFSFNAFDWQVSNEDLMRIVQERFGEKSEEYRKTEEYDFVAYKAVFKNFFRSKQSPRDFKKGIKLLESWHKRIDWQQISSSRRGVKFYIFKHFYIAIVLFSAKYKKNNVLQVASEKTSYIAKNRILKNKYYAWYVTRVIREKNNRKDLDLYYDSVGINHAEGGCVVCIYDGAIKAGGLADRLKGILSVYYICKNKDIPFKLYFTDPFPLNEFFVPNKYDWLIRSKDICKDKNDCDIVVLDNTQDSYYQKCKQREYLGKMINYSEKQIHVYTNASFVYDEDYSSLFHELFRMSNKLQKSIDRVINDIGKKFISVSCRFLDLLGDFNETFGYGEPLKPVEKERLINRVLGVISSLHRENPNHTILVNSDSITFLKRARLLEYTYVIEGNVTHIDNDKQEYSYERYEKTFLDFMMISQAEKIYLIKSKEMYKSGFPYAASKISNKPFEIIQI